MGKSLWPDPKPTGRELAKARVHNAKVKVRRAAAESSRIDRINRGKTKAPWYW